MSQLHADLVFLLVGLTIGAWPALRAAEPPNELSARHAGCSAWRSRKGPSGSSQYATDLPVVLVGIHMLGAALIAAAATWLALGTRDRGLQRT